MLLELKQTTTYAINPFLLKFVTIRDYLFDIHDSDLEKIRWFDQKNKLSRDGLRSGPIIRDYNYVFMIPEI